MHAGLGDCGLALGWVGGELRLILRYEEVLGSILVGGD
jgi:hypothetical protein